MDQSKTGFADLIAELDSIRFLSGEGPAALLRLYQEYGHVFIAATADTQMHFATLFSRMSFALTRKPYPGTLKYHLHHFRVEVENQGEHLAALDVPDQELLFQEGKWALWQFLEKWSGETAPKPLDSTFKPGVLKGRKKDSESGFVRQMKVLVIGEGEERSTLRGIEETAPEREVMISFGQIGKNDLYAHDVQGAMQYPGVPFTVQLVDVEIESDGLLVPKIIVIEPDLLVDVSTVAECTTDLNQPRIIHILKKFIPVEKNPAILMGGIANSFLDTLVRNPEGRFIDVFRDAFQFNKLAFTCLPDEEIVRLMNKAKDHFRHLQHVIRSDFHKLGINRLNCIIEPSFYAPAYGIQGRLDLYHEPEGQAGKADIIELKSGRLFRPNNYGLNANHYTQTLLYDLLIRAVKEFRQKNNCYILYSGEKDKTLKFAPPVESLQKEAIHTRNQIVITESFLQHAAPGQIHRFLETVSPEKFPYAKGYHLTNLQLFQKVYAGLSPGEQLYLNLFTGFIAREYALSKKGEQGIESVNGLASLWLDSDQEKFQKFSIFKHLKLNELVEDGNDIFVSFDLPDEMEILTNFRVGDIAVLYPETGRKRDILRHQIYKCTLIDIQHAFIVVQLRNYQVSRTIFEQHTHWNLEHDQLDSSFSNQYQSLYTFASQDAVARSLFLGSIPPRKADQNRSVPAYPEMLPDQQSVLRKMIDARDYFLLWGPPGTGKTSVMIRYAVAYYLAHTEAQLLLVAYTNRAVDEICAAIDQIGNHVRDLYVRFGSRVSTNARYKDQLFSQKTSTFTTRKEIASFIESQRIVVGTISSLMGNEELMKLKTFDVAIVDEASQILEPMLAGLLTRIKKKILIGDHKQLPAVVLQSPQDTLVTDPRMERICLTDMRDSYFERLYRLCIQKHWDWAFDRLSHQGRMHEEIMDVANASFYQGSLQLLVPKQRPTGAHYQVEPLSYPILPDADDWLLRVCQQRVAFAAARVTDHDLLHKTNDDEARICVALIRMFRTIYALNQMPWHQQTLGIITPFRAQIALIRKMCHTEGVDPSLVTIDTVERYQGSARDVIILSTAVTSPSQLAHIVAENQEGIDRKLNVSLTRARKQFIMTGDPDTLKRNTTYARFIETYQV